MKIQELIDKESSEKWNENTYIAIPCKSPNCIYKKMNLDTNLYHIQLNKSYQYYDWTRVDKKTYVQLSIQYSGIDNAISVATSNGYNQIELEFEDNHVFSVLHQQYQSFGLKLKPNIDKLQLTSLSINSVSINDLYRHGSTVCFDFLNTRVDLYDMLNRNYGNNSNIDLSIVETINKMYYFYSMCKYKTRDEFNKGLEFLFDRYTFDWEKIEGKGIKNVLTQITPFYEKFLENKDKFGELLYVLFVGSSNRTLNNVKLSVLLNKFFGDVLSYEDFVEKIKILKDLVIDDYFAKKYLAYNPNQILEIFINKIDESLDIRRSVIKKKNTGSFNKIMEHLDFVNIDKDKYPLIHAAIFDGVIPVGAFFRKKVESYFMYNDNWEILEEMMEKYPDIVVAIAAEAARRTTYEKDFMSYCYFVLRALPNYLEKHTGKKWKGIPKLVVSANELEPDTTPGTVKSRSALTPIVDNDKCEIVVPYVSMAVPGYQTTYCYGLDYNLIQEGFVFQGNVAMSDIEKSLNGKDDYGLMFYTLTGSAQGRGYPTFLIIFERLEDSTKVHFHRTHPLRSKDGDYNPVHSWIVGCYKWMVGNVKFENIKVQQGDLVFVKIDEFPENEVTEVNSYDNHMFEKPVKFSKYIKSLKDNVLGYVKIESDTMLNHHEHLNVLIEEGSYEIRQCRSWEANPVGIWSLRID